MMSKVNYTEEYWRIELIKFLLDKGYQKEEFRIEYTVKLGNPERDRLIADVCVFKDDLAYIVGEVKKHKDSKKKRYWSSIKACFEFNQGGIWYLFWW